jgi:hypothetical protein
MSGHPGAMGVTADPPAGAGAGSRELSPWLDGAARVTGDTRSGASHGSCRRVPDVSELSA